MIALLVKIFFATLPESTLTALICASLALARKSVQCGSLYHEPTPGWVSGIANERNGQQKSKSGEHRKAFGHVVRILNERNLTKAI